MSDTSAPVLEAPSICTEPSGNRSTPSSGPLSVEDHRLLVAASKQMRRIRRASMIAKTSGWSMACFALITVLLGLLSPTSLITGCALGIVAWNELRGASLLERLELKAPMRLALNQCVLLVLVVLYCIWNIAVVLYGSNPYSEVLAQGGPAADTIRPIANMISTVTVLVYVAVMIGSLIAQGSLAAYYASRRSHLRAYVDATPAWIIRMQRDAPLA